MPLKHGPIEGSSPIFQTVQPAKFSMPLKHGPIEGIRYESFLILDSKFSMPLKHGPIEGLSTGRKDRHISRVFHAPKAWPH